LSKIVSVEGLHYAYPTIHPDEEKTWVLRGVDLEVEEREFLSIMGPTGVGKTTLCLALNGIVPQSVGGTIKGDVIVDGLNTKRTPVPDLAQRVGVIFQEPETQLFNMSVESEIAFGLESLGTPAEEIEERVEWALAAVGMSEFRHRSPFHLSGGQKQRTAIAAILAMRPKILVLDEPTASLDPIGKTEVFSVVRELRRQHGMTIIMVEFESERIAEFSDRVVVLRDGQVALEGTPVEIFKQVPLMHEIGLAVPQVSELADCLNQQHATDYVFTQLDEAYDTLTGPQGIAAKGSQQ
jgi:energy-coupling factor transporter ATP-binding protein EcfA2